MQRILTFLLASWLLMPLAGAAEPIGEARNPSGEVKFRRDTEETYRELADTSITVFNLDSWQTEDGATFEILLSNGTILVVGSGTELNLWVDEPARQVTVEISRGSVKALTLNSPDYRTTMLTPSAYVQAGSGVHVIGVPDEGTLDAQAEQGELTMVHNYGTNVRLRQGQAATIRTDFDLDGRTFRILAASENNTPIQAEALKRIRFNLPSGTEMIVVDSLVPGAGGALTIQAASGNSTDIMLNIGDPDQPPEQTHPTAPGERVMIRFGRPFDTQLQIDVGDTRPPQIPTVPTDDPMDNMAGRMETPAPVPIPVIPIQVPDPVPDPPSPPPGTP